MSACSRDAARAAKARALEVFGQKAQVVGVGITRIGGGYGVKVNLGAPPAPDADLPDTVDGVPVRVEVVGTIRPR
jgi:xanthine dehydrogenase molybdopterin-binding subunit B